MVETVHRAFEGRGIAFMLDVEQRYERWQAAAAVRRLEPLGMTWFEAPLLDGDLAGYAELRRSTWLPIIPAGNTILDLQQVAAGLGSGAWSMARVDATIAGGITPTRKIMAVAEAHNTSCELQCWGYTLTQAANLHLMLGHGNCRYFEQPAPYPAFEYGSVAGIRPDANGDVVAPEGPGLGVLIDWSAVDRAALLRYELRP
jgi:L-alanine-DL-glutamate epimerase-like enolase superfamily enzyme